MAIAFGGISSVSTASSLTSIAVSGSDTLGIVYVVGETSGDNITAVTWGGSSMTKISAVQTPGDRWISAWWIANPTSSSTIAFTGGAFFRSFHSYYTGAAQTGQVDSSGTNTSSSSNVISASTTVVASDCWAIMFQKDNSGGRVYTSSNAMSTTRADNDAGGIGIADSNGTVSTGSITGTMTQTVSTSNHGAIIFSIAPVGAAPSASDNALAWCNF